MNKQSTQVSNQVVKINFKYIIDNATKESLWGKTWTIFDYDNFIITLRLDEIKILDGRLLLVLKAKATELDLGSPMHWMSLPIDRAHYNINVFKNSLRRLTHSMINSFERSIARTHDEYKAIREKERELDEQYLQELKDYLDAEEVHAEDIRKAYVANNVK